MYGDSEVIKIHSEDASINHSEVTVHSQRFDMLRLRHIEHFDFE